MQPIRLLLYQMELLFREISIPLVCLPLVWSWCLCFCTLGMKNPFEDESNMLSHWTLWGEKKQWWTCSVVPMWLLCDDALVSCPQRDTIQTVSSSALLHMLCRSLFRILKKRRRRKISHFCITWTVSMWRLAHANELPRALTWQSQVGQFQELLESAEL